MMYNKTKQTKRFTYGISRNPTSHKAGANTVTISTRSEDQYYATPTVGLTMTVKEARALQNFLNAEFPPVVQADSSSIG